MEENKNQEINEVLLEDGLDGSLENLDPEKQRELLIEFIKAKHNNNKTKKDFGKTYKKQRQKKNKAQRQSRATNRRK